MKNVIWKSLVAAAFVGATAAACGGGGGGSTPAPTTPTSPTNPTTPTTPTGPNPSIATITIGTDGRVSPSSVTIAPGGRVTFVNNHNQSHDMSSDPHPEHTDCTQMAQIGFLSAGQSRTSGNFNNPRTCGFHDHNLPDNAGLKGTIVIQ
jgi:plastocyanin